MRKGIPVCLANHFHLTIYSIFAHLPVRPLTAEDLGRGVLQDFIQTHMWYNLSAARGEDRSAEARDALAKQMTPGQIAEAQRLAREWRPREEKSRKTVY